MFKRKTSIQHSAYKWMQIESDYGRNDLVKADLTQFVENCAHSLDHDEWLDDPDHWVWEMALDFIEDD